MVSVAVEGLAPGALVDSAYASTRPQKFQSGYICSVVTTGNFALEIKLISHSVHKFLFFQSGHLEFS
jgi:ribosomal protein L21E